jgi:hypothetical protein
MSIFTAAWRPGARCGRLSPISTATSSLLTPLPASVLSPVAVPFCSHTFPDPNPASSRSTRSSKTTLATKCTTCELHREAEEAAREYLVNGCEEPDRLKWESSRCRIANHAHSQPGDTDGCSEVYVLPHCARQAVKDADELSEDLAAEEAIASNGMTPQSGNTNAPQRPEQPARTLKSCFAGNSLSKATTTPRSLTFATYADVNTAPNPYTHHHRDENLYRHNWFYQRTRGPEVYEPRQWAAPSDGRLLNTSGAAINGWGEEEDGEVGDIKREELGAAWERELLEAARKRQLEAARGRELEAARGRELEAAREGELAESE